MSMRHTAFQFFDACETGKGWDTCRQWCLPDATFSVQADALADVTTLEGYVEWASGLLTPVPDGHYELKALAVDEDRETVVIASVFHGSHTVDAGSPPTGKSVATDYCYILNFKGGKISHMTKVWNDGFALRQIGWA